MSVFNSDLLRRLARVAPRLSVLVAILVGSGAEPVAGRTLKPLEVKQEYRRVLTRLAAGEEDQALADLLTMELAAVGDAQAWRYVDNLWRAKLRVIRELLETGQLDLLRPIMVLHYDAYFEYVELGRRHLAHHSRTMASELADIYAARAATPEAASFAGWVLTSFGVYLWSPSDIGESADFFFRAQEHDPGNRVALEGLAAAYERGGNYELAIATLEQALRLAPDDPEQQLRLALCNLRFAEGDATGAIRQLESLTEVDRPAWIRSVAYQELARVMIDDERPDDAEAILRSGLTDLAGDQQLSIELASLLDRRGRRIEEDAVLDQIRIEGWEQDSPRLTYDFWQPPDLESLGDQLHREMAVGIVALKASLDSGGGA